MDSFLRESGRKDDDSEVIDINSLDEDKANRILEVETKKIESLRVGTQNCSQSSQSTTQVIAGPKQPTLANNHFHKSNRSPVYKQTNSTLQSKKSQNQPQLKQTVKSPVKSKDRRKILYLQGQNSPVTLHCLYKPYSKTKNRVDRKPILLGRNECARLSNDRIAAELTTSKDKRLNGSITRHSKIKKSLNNVLESTFNSRFSQNARSIDFKLKTASIAKKKTHVLSSQSIIDKSLESNVCILQAAAKESLLPDINAKCNIERKANNTLPKSEFQPKIPKINSNQMPIQESLNAKSKPLPSLFKPASISIASYNSLQANRAFANRVPKTDLYNLTSNTHITKQTFSNLSNNLAMFSKKKSSVESVFSSSLMKTNLTRTKLNKPQ
jgi:hypothetical protein